MLIGSLSEFQLHPAEAEVNWETFDIPKEQPSLRSGHQRL